MENKVVVLTMNCRYCGWPIDEEADRDVTGRGAWCDVCDAYNFYGHVPNADRNKFLLYLENPCQHNVSGKRTGLRLNKRLSPLRYPGGKAKIADFIASQLHPHKRRLFVEPYAGGAGAGLALLDAGLVEHLHINEKDPGIHALFFCILNDPDALLQRLRDLRIDHDSYWAARNRLQTGPAADSGRTADTAWDTLVVNRLAYSGIFTANPLGGRNGSRTELLSRWNPVELAKRINRIHQLRERIHLTIEDALEVIEENYWVEDASMLIDPPYVEKGEMLYRYSYCERQHRELEGLLESLFLACPGADILLFYDNHPLVDDLYWLPELIPIPRSYSA